MKKILLSFCALISMQLFAQQVVINDANAEKRLLSGSFNAIEVSDGIELMLTKSDEESIAVSASDSKYIERIITEVSGGTLKISYENKGMVWNKNDRRKLIAYVSFKLIDKIQASSGAEVSSKNVLKLAVLEIKLSSGAQFNGEVNIGQLTSSQNSGASANITGKAEKLSVEASSGAIFKGFDLVVDECIANANSGGGVRINVTKELDASANSGGGIRYKGAGVIKNINVNSGGIVKRAS